MWLPVPGRLHDRRIGEDWAPRTPAVCITPAFSVLTELSRTLKKRPTVDSTQSTSHVQGVSGHVWRFAGCEFDELGHELRVRGQQ